MTLYSLVKLMTWCLRGGKAWSLLLLQTGHGHRIIFCLLFMMSLRRDWQVILWSHEELCAR